MLALLLLAALAAGADPTAPIYDLRAWKGTVTVRSLSRESAYSKGREAQEERVEFVVVTKPPSKRLPAMEFEPRSVAGSWSLIVDRSDRTGGQAVRKKGEGSGRLHARVRGIVDPRTGKYVLRVDVSPKKLVVKTTLSGFENKRFRTFRTVMSRRPFLVDFRAEGTVEEDGRLLRGERKFVDRNHRLSRDVVIRWEVRRIDPIVAGRVRDHLGRPAAGMKVIARHTTGARAARGLPRITKEAVTDGAGRFSIAAFHGWWSLRVVGHEKSGVLFAGRRVKELVELKEAESPEFDVEVKAYALRLLPTPQLLHRHFRGDVDGYVAYISARVRGGDLNRALVTVRSQGKNGG